MGGGSAFMILTCPNCATRYNADAAKFLKPRKVRCARCSTEWVQEPPQDLPMEVTAAAPEPVAPAPAPPAPEPVAHEPEPAPPVREPEPVAAEPSYSEPAYAEPAYAEPRYEAPQRTYEPEPRIVQQSYGAAATADDFFDETAPAPPARAAARLPAVNWAAAAGWVILVSVLGVGGWAVVNYRTEIATAWPQASSFYAVIGAPVNITGLEIEPPQMARQVQDGRSVLAVSGRLRNVSGREVAVPVMRATLFDAEDRELESWTFNVDPGRLKPGETANYNTRYIQPPAEAVKVEIAADEPKG